MAAADYPTILMNDLAMYLGQAVDMSPLLLSGTSPLHGSLMSGTTVSGGLQTSQAQMERIGELEGKLAYSELRRFVATDDNNRLREALIAANKELADLRGQLAGITKPHAPDPAPIKGFPAQALSGKPVRIGLIETFR